MASSYNPKIVTDGLVLCLDAANPKSYPGSGNIWYDLSGKGNHGTLTNGPIYNSANKGSIVFDGVNDYVLVNNLNLSSTDKITIGVLFNTTSNGKMILEHSINWNSNNSFGILIGPDVSPFGKVQFVDRTISPSGYNVVYSNTILNTGNWINYYCSSDRTLLGTNQSLVYTNGNLNSVQAAGYTADLSGNYGSYPLYIGSRAGSSTFLQGNISQISIYNKALSATEIQQNFNATRGRYGI